MWVKIYLILGFYLVYQVPELLRVYTAHIGRLFMKESLDFYKFHNIDNPSKEQLLETVGKLMISLPRLSIWRQQTNDGVSNGMMA